MKYLWMSTSPPVSTGYGILTKNVTERLIKKGCDLWVLGLQTIGIQKEERLLPVLNDVYGKDALQNYVPYYGIDAVITILDHWVPVYHYIPQVLKDLNCLHIAHVTANSTPLGAELYTQLKDADFLIAPSDYVEKLLLEVFPKEKVRKIYHGIDTKIFKSFSEEEKSKEKAGIGYMGKFIFLTIGTNTGLQKNWPGLFYAYKIFLQNNPVAKENTILHCHTDMHYPGGYDLELLAKRFGITENVYFIDTKLNAGTPPEKMAQIYNLSDCFVSASYGESFSLPLLESMACGLPVIFPNHSTGSQLVGEPKSGLLVDLIKMKNKQEFGFTSAFNLSDQFHPDPIDMAEKMEKIYKDKELREKFSRNGVRFAKKFDWEKIVPQWLDFFKYIEEFKEPVDYSKRKLGI